MLLTSCRLLLLQLAGTFVDTGLGLQFLHQLLLEFWLRQLRRRTIADLLNWAGSTRQTVLSRWLATSPPPPTRPPLDS